MFMRLVRAESPAARLAWFVGGLAVMLLALEFLEHRHTDVIVAASHRGLTKAAMFQRHSRVAVLFLGTSRTQDGVSPDLVTRGLAAVAPELGDLPGFNAAFTGSSLGSLVSLAPRFDGRPDVRVAVIELSDPQIFNEPAPWDEPARSSETLEDRLADTASRVYVVRYRKALLGGNLGRLPSLLFASSLGGWETKGSEQLASWLGHRESPATGFEPSRWRPEIIAPTTAVRALDTSLDATATELAALARRFRARGIVPVFAVPPLGAAERDAPERHGLRPVFAEVARRGACEVWNFAALTLPDDYFRDPTHLNRAGRAQYSEALARGLAPLLASR
jgi:hypothetical protein